MNIECPSCGRKNRVPAAATGVPHCGSCQATLPWLVDADDETFREVVEEARLPVLLDVWAEWCGPCRMVSPILERLAAEYAGRVKLVKVDADKAPGVSRRFGVQAIPTLLVLQRGREVSRQIGAAPEVQLGQWLRDALAASDQAAGGTTTGSPSS